MNVIVLEVGIVAALLLLNALFSMSEMAIVSAKKARLQQLASKGSKKAGKALQLAESPNRFLSTIQIGITLVGVLSGAFGGATISEKIGETIARIYGLSPEVSEGIGVGIIVTIITFFSVVLGELVPKRLALKYPETIATLAAGPMDALSRFSAPVVWLFSASTDLILKFLRLNQSSNDANITHDEIRAMVEQGAQEGLLDAQEKLMFDRVLSFGRKRVTALMTLARDMIWIDVNKTLEEQSREVLNSSYTMYPVAEGSLDHLLGTVKSNDLGKLFLDGQRDTVSLLFQPVFIPETATALQVLEIFQKTGLQMGFVIDEFGAIQGLLTMSDITRAIVGETPLDAQHADSPIVKRADGSWLVDGALPIDILKEKLGIERLDGEDAHLFQTVGGFIMHRLGRVPRETDVFHWSLWRFEILDMDRNRIDKVMISEEGLRPHMSDSDVETKHLHQVDQVSQRSV
jgi:putative hemolysin